MHWLFGAVWLASLVCHCLLAVTCELSVNAHRPFVLHCSEHCSPLSLSPRAGFVSSVQHQGLTEQWGEMWKGSDSGSCLNGRLESFSWPAGAGFAPFGLKCEHFITAPFVWVWNWQRLLYQIPPFLFSAPCWGVFLQCQTVLADVYSFCVHYVGDELG